MSFQMSRSNKSILFLILFTLIQYNYGLSRIDPLVDTKLGLIRGLKATDGDYAKFLGIPYGLVNASNPFGISAPHPKFDEIFEAYDDPSVCPQFLREASFGSLDCLRLNVYVPSSASSRNRLPVLVWIHGGGFSMGSTEGHGPKFLVKHDIILVTINYRLGPYGFMCLNTAEVPGNQGLKDQRLALKWVNENIAEFGGDVTKITIGGGSAGSMSVDFHSHFDNEKLFSKIIMHSGTTLTPTFDEPVPNAPIPLSEKLGFETDDINKAIDFLSNIDPILVTAAANELGLMFWPCVETEFEGVESFAKQNWIAANVANAKNMPVLIGINDNEQLQRHVNGDSEYFRNLNTVEKQLFNRFDVNDEKFDGMKDIVYQFYFGDEGISEDTKWKVIDFDSDFHFNHPTSRSIDKYIRNGAGNIYFYVFSYVGETSYVKRTNLTAVGTTHGDEHAYIFNTDSMDPNADDQIIIDRMTTMWTNFMKYGDPTPDTSELLPTKWIPNTAGSSRYYMNISSDLSINTRPFNDRMAFWDLFFTANSNLERIYPGNNVIVD